MKFEFATSNRIIFGNGTLSEIGRIAADFGQQALLVVGGGSVSTDQVLDFLKGKGVSAEIFRVEHEPDIPAIEAGIAAAQSAKCDLVIGFGGGSVIDSAKAIAAMLTNPGELMDYLEVVGSGKKISKMPAPVIAVPTTAGTGTEVTRNAVIMSPEHHVKVSMRSPKMIPTVALVDPELTYSMPPSVTASTGMDALTQVIEAYVTRKTNPMTDAIAREGIKRGGRSLLVAYENGQNKAAREDMAVTSLFGGLALANSGLGAVHGFAGPIGGMFNAPHGVICASLLPYVMKYNAHVLVASGDMADLEDRFREIAVLLTGDADAAIQDGVQWLIDLARALKIPKLREIGIKQSDFDRIIEKSKVSSSMQKNPISLEESVLIDILQEAY